MPSEIRAVSFLPGRPAWNDRSVFHVGLSAAKRERLAIPMLASKTPLGFCSKPIRTTLALHHGHALSLPAPDWGFQLTEPQATYGLAHMIDGRPTRMLGLLNGLKVTETEQVEQATIIAEEDRVDLLIRMGNRAIIVEAKFGHHVTDGQLSNYWKKISRSAKPEGILLLIDPDDAPELHHAQKKHWRIISWAEMLLGLERAMKDNSTEDDDDFRLFRRLVWERIGGLSMGEKNR